MTNARRHQASGRFRLSLRCALACLLLASFRSASAGPESLQVLHWWTSASERHAVSVLSSRLAKEGVVWDDGAVPGGAGVGAGKVLKSRVLAGSAPDITQIIGVSLGEWAELGLLLELDDASTAGNWGKVMFPTIWNLVHQRGHTVAAPLGIHRTNTLLYNRKLFARLHLALPATWSGLEALAVKLRAAGVAPLVQSSEAWQVATLFENIVLSVGGADYYRDLFVHQSARAAADPRLVTALERLRQMKTWMAPIQEQPWTDVAKRFARGEGAMMVMGDWAKAELNETGFPVDQEFACGALPGTEHLHLYSVDTLAAFANDYSHSAAEDKLARTVMTPQVQQQYNAAKGSVPVRRDAATGGMDSCARASYAIFGKGASVQVPSLVHRMATDEESRDAIIAEVQRYFADDSVPAAQVQKRLATVFRTFSSRLHKP
ncbi:MAG TPA: ABC transporter substrate-binding protein [Telluria sp.]|nr:ABC transporter substrate-binding protein [Telluria sp.]